MTNTVCIDRSILGTDRHLVLDEGFSWTSAVPREAWHLSGDIKLHSDRCMDTLLRLGGRQLDLAPPARFVAAMSQLMSGSQGSPPWSQVMPTDQHRTFVKKLVNDAKETVGQLSQDYYVNAWVPQSHVLRSLQPARVDPVRWRAAVEASGTNSRILEGFRPDRDGFAAPVVYNRFGTRTGRLTVESGPNILTLKKELRAILQPSSPGGRIVFMDFAALEARILLYESGGRCDDVDMYSYINRELFGGAASRKAVKGAVISELYGSSKTALGAVLGISGRELDTFVDKVKSFFRTGDLKKRIKEEFARDGCITNRHGRRIAIEEPMDHIFVNSYAQSTGVDVSLLGFSEVVRSLSDCHGVRPLFVLHDALVMDVAPQDLDFVMKIKSVKAPGYIQRFPLIATV